MAKIICCDLDGTLFYPKEHTKFLSHKNREFIQRWIDAGNRFVLVTSRSDDFVERVIKEIDRKVDYIAFTGAIISIDGKQIRNTPMERDVCYNSMTHIINEFKPIGLVLSNKKIPLLVSSYYDLGRMFKILYRIWYLKYGFYREPILYDREEFARSLKEEDNYSAKIFFGIRPKKNKINKEINKAIRDEYPSIEASWVGVAIEISPKGCNKADSIEFVANYLKANPKDIYVIGDSGNDISMFNKYHENSFVMAHAYPTVKKYAKHVVRRVYKIEKYL